MNVSKLQEIVKDRVARQAEAYGVAESDKTLWLNNNNNKTVRTCPISLISDFWVNTTADVTVYTNDLFSLYTSKTLSKGTPQSTQATHTRNTCVEFLKCIA